MADSESPKVIDYEGTDYQADFWEGKGRAYEDQVERIAIRRLLPPVGDRLIEIGAGFGRLVPLYSGYKQIVLFDYSRSLLEQARQQYGDNGFLYVAGNIYEMPFAPGVFDAVLMVRVLHHMQDAPAALAAVRSIMKRGRVFLLEFANKQNLKAIGRWLLRRQSWNPISDEPIEFVELHYDFHPHYIREKLNQASFKPGKMLTVSHYRIALLKRIIPTKLLVAMDSIAQLTGNWWQLSPSVFVRSEAVGEDKPVPAGAFWRCPHCGSLEIEESAERLTCSGCKVHYVRRSGVYDFKEPVTR